MSNLRPVAAAACAGALAAGGAWASSACAPPGDCDARGRPLAAVARPDRALEADRPLTTAVPLPDELSRAMAQAAAADAPALRLSIHGVVSPPADAALRVFLDRAEADASTPVSDPHYAGSVTFFPRTPEGGDPRSFLLDLTRTLARLRARGYEVGRTAQITLVLVPLRKGESLAGVRVSIECVSISVV